MREDDGDPRIVPPRPHRAADVGRALARAAAGAIPLVGSAATELANGLLPDPPARRRSEWERDVSEEVNGLGGRVDEIDRRTGAREVELTGAAAAAAFHMVKGCPDGWTSLDGLVETHPDLTRQELLDGWATSRPTG